MALSYLLAPSLQAAATILNVGSAITRGRAAKAIGARKQAAAEFEAKQLVARAEQERSIGMIGAQDEIRKTQIINSAALARAASSGAGASDPNVIHLLTQTAGMGAYRAAVAMYQGEEQARLSRLRAAATRFEGDTAAADAKIAARQANLTAASTLLSGGLKGLSLYEKFYAGPQLKDTA